MVSRFDARWTGFAALSVRWTTAGLPTTWMGELLPADALIELVVRDGIDDFLHRALVEIPLPFGRAAGRVDRWWPTRLAHMDENTLNRRFIGDCGDQTHLGAAVWADQR